MTDKSKVNSMIPAPPNWYGVFVWDKEVTSICPIIGWAWDTNLEDAIPIFLGRDGETFTSWNLPTDEYKGVIYPNCPPMFKKHLISEGVDLEEVYKLIGGELSFDLVKGRG